MSLNKQAANFAKSMASAHTAQRRVVSTPTPAESTTPSTNGGTPKRKRPIPQFQQPTAPPIVYSQPADNVSLEGQNFLTQVQNTLSFLKNHEKPRTAAEIFDFLHIPYDPSLLEVLKASIKVIYDRQADTYEYRPLHNIRSDTSLLAFLQAQTTAQGLPVKELKEGWSGALETINTLEAEREILVTRTKKDNQPRMVWINDKTLDSEVDDEFKDIWHRVKIPPPGELPGELEKLGTKPTSVDPATIKKEVKPAHKRKKAANRRIKITNNHMSGILKDTKDLRKS